MIRKHIIAHGRVQGVGLRFTVTGFAKKYNVTGWVRNLYDGTVEMEVQGDENSIQQMLVQIQKQRWIEVNHMEIMEIACVEERGFRIR